VTPHVPDDGNRPRRPVRVVIADDHLVVRAGLEGLLRGWPTVEVVASVADGREAVRAAEELDPDVVLMDLSMPVMGGIEATRRITAGPSSARVLALTSFDDAESVGAVIDAGAVGYLLKDSDPATLRAGIEAAADGGAPLHPRVARHLITQRQTARSGTVLTDRELEVLDLLRAGLANKEIASRLGITVKTVKAHLTSLFQKIGVMDRTQAALWAERTGATRPTTTRP
jgi:DNA-binding NarL/FixJ family response regulator